jgi:ABC-2 type transport system permease protein
MSQLLRIVHMEWTKLRTDPGTRWYVLAVVGVTVATTATACATTDIRDCAPRPCTVDTVRIALAGAWIGYAPAAVLAILVIGHEYDTGLIRTTLAASPCRVPIVIAKAGLGAAVATAASAIGLALSVATARVTLPHRGFTAVNGYPALPSLFDGPTRSAYLHAVSATGLVALLGLGLALIARHIATAITTTLGLLYLAPVVALFVTDPVWQERIRRYAPVTADPAAAGRLRGRGAPGRFDPVPPPGRLTPAGASADAATPS